MKFWTVTEIQVDANGGKAASSACHDTYENALSAYYYSLAAGAINGIPYHATYLADSSKGVKMFNIYDRSDNNG